MTFNTDPVAVAVQQDLRSMANAESFRRIPDSLRPGSGSLPETIGRTMQGDSGFLRE